MDTNPPIRFSHNHHQLSVKGCASEPDVLAFDGQEYLSKPFSYRIEFTSPDHAITSCPTLSPGQVLTVTGGYDVAEVFAQGVLITTMHSHARRDEDFAVNVGGIPDCPDFSFRPEPGTRPVMAGTLPARVTSTTQNDTYGHIDKSGRYSVNMLFDRDNREAGFESLWVRQSRPYAGDTYGHDTCSQEHIKVSTEYGGKSQLNLGYLVDSEKQQRGEGFELRTDGWGVIRAQKGIFISADGQARTQGKVLEMERGLSLLKDVVNQITEWGSIIQNHHNFSPDADSLREFVDGASNLKEAALLMAASKGIAAVTPDTSGKGLYLQSPGEVNIATAQRHSVNATKAIYLLSQQEGIRVISAKGLLEVESHADTLSLTSLKDVTVQSTQGYLQLTAMNGITIACGGAYIRLTPQREIRVHGPGLLSLKGQHNMEGPVSQDFPLPELPSSVCKDHLKRAQEIAQGLFQRRCKSGFRFSVDGQN